jgi:hypothetical protein
MLELGDPQPMNKYNNDINVALYWKDKIAQENILDKRRNSKNNLNMSTGIDCTFKIKYPDLQVVRVKLKLS